MSAGACSCDAFLEISMPSLRMTQEDLDNYNAKRNDAKNSGQVRDLQQRPDDESETTNGFKGFVQKVDIFCTHYRRKLADPDGPYTKHFVDGLVEAGVLRDDSLEEVNEIRHPQIKIESWEEEYFEIRIVETEQGELND